MKKNIVSPITTISLGNIEDIADNLFFANNDVKMVHFTQSDPMQSPLVAGCLLIGICKEGNVDIQINTHPYHVESPSIIIILPGSIFSFATKRESQNTVFQLIALSDNFIQSQLHMRLGVWQIGHYFFLNPVLQIKDNNSYKFRLYIDLINNLSADNPTIFKDEAIQNVLAAALYEILEQTIDKNKAEDAEEKNKLINDKECIICRKFFEYLIKDEGKHRTVGYFANLLCYSPKHLWTMVNKVTGSSPLKIINEHTADRIKYHLIYSNMELTDIAHYFKFCNYSFFGKFVKKHLGSCPRKYRELNRQRVQM